MGRCSPFSCVADTSYDWPSFVIWAAASWRTFSRSAFRAARSPAALEPIAAESGSLWYFSAASRFAWAPFVSRGIDAWAVAIAFDASLSHFAEFSLKSPRR
ncbi:hypothetical protein RKE30_03910 [Streptomyces sp. Li-HN-5-11]|uniref:hypothetical protein n=1 Tax=Streptomyces sp. Li-HN-5-11 TaxID=3075432 RepID=UPI0028AAD8B5|nr:hypothetical protein [Streptomyces sp. Li-HN-5-11]WNM29597.1 hypothetical protein RKE30_03910 [Streptomyces sp. Li-HN-5-11]